MWHVQLREDYEGFILQALRDQKTPNRVVAKRTLSPEAINVFSVKTLHELLSTSGTAEHSAELVRLAQFTSGNEDPLLQVDSTWNGIRAFVQMQYPQLSDFRESYGKLPDENALSGMFGAMVILVNTETPLMLIADMSQTMNSVERAWNSTPDHERMAHIRKVEAKKLLFTTGKNIASLLNRDGNRVTPENPFSVPNFKAGYDYWFDGEIKPAVIRLGGDVESKRALSMRYFAKAFQALDFDAYREKVVEYISKNELDALTVVYLEDVFETGVEYDAETDFTDFRNRINNRTEHFIFEMGSH